MPIQKFKSFEEARQAQWCFEPDDEYYKRVGELFELADELCPFRYPQGVFKFKTFEEAQQHNLNQILKFSLSRLEKSAE